MRIALLLFVTFFASAAASAAPDELVARGRYLARLGNCAGCHTAPGGEPFAGGRAVEGPFGTFYAPNITPEPATGIGSWTADQFWAALHEGKRPDGSPLYPACPYPNFTKVRREDVDAIYAYLRSVPPARQAERPHVLSVLASWRPLVTVWQWLFFEPGSYRSDPSQSDQWNRGAYLVEGLGHCSACHAERNVFGAVRPDRAIRGSTVHEWYAPSLYSSAEAGLQRWPPDQAATLLRAGKAGDASTLGPMADIVFNSLQYLTEADALAMATYLRALPDHTLPPLRRPRRSEERIEADRALGRSVYEKHCLDCHGEDGQGSVAAPALAGNRAVTMSDQTNLRNVLRHGGYPPSTEGNPRPFGMPPFYNLDTRELNAVATYIRMSWGNEQQTRRTASD
jgi:mono/diheme cytochrome c family protein